MSKASDKQVGGNHYKDMPIEPSEFCQRNRLNWCESNVIKYVCRHRSKNGEQDIRKAIHYLELLLEWEYGVAEPANQPHEEEVETFDLIAHLRRQRDFSCETFGPGKRTAGVLDHIQKELREIALCPSDLTEWVDVVLLALDGAWRQGYEPEEIAAALEAKQTRNEGRTWPDWRTVPEGQAIEHVRVGEAPKVPTPGRTCANCATTTCGMVVPQGKRGESYTSLCESCAKANVSCEVYPQETAECRHYVGVRG